MATTANGPTCDNCGTGHRPDDIFCESCGYDFITGSLPRAEEGFVLPPGGAGGAPGSGLTSEVSTGPGVAAPAGVDAPSGSAGNGGGLFGPPSAPAPTSGGLGLFEPRSGERSPVVRMRFTVAVDRAYFDVVVAEGELVFPDPVPPHQEVGVGGDEVHLGRTSESRAIHPDLDIGRLTGDPAVSSRHAMIKRLPDGSLTVTDVGSTNGTFVGSVDSESIAVGETMPLAPGLPVFLGAWTRVTVVPEGA